MCIDEGETTRIGLNCRSLGFLIVGDPRRLAIDPSSPGLSLSIPLPLNDMKTDSPILLLSFFADRSIESWGHSVDDR